jgi:hypothetical protein
LVAAANPAELHLDGLDIRRRHGADVDQGGGECGDEAAA